MSVKWEHMLRVFERDQLGDIQVDLTRDVGPLVAAS